MATRGAMSVVCRGQRCQVLSQPTPIGVPTPQRQRLTPADRPLARSSTAQSVVRHSVTEGSLEQPSLVSRPRSLSPTGINLRQNMFDGPVTRNSIGQSSLRQPGMQTSVPTGYTPRDLTLVAQVRQTRPREAINLVSVPVEECQGSAPQLIPATGRKDIGLSMEEQLQKKDRELAALRAEIEALRCQQAHSGQNSDEQNQQCGCADESTERVSATKAFFVERTSAASRSRSFSPSGMKTPTPPVNAKCRPRSVSPTGPSSSCSSSVNAASCNLTARPNLPNLNDLSGWLQSNEYEVLPIQASRLLEEILKAFFGTQNCSIPLAATRSAWGFETDIQMLCSVLRHSTTGDKLQRILSSLATCYVWEGDVHEFAKNWSK